MDTHQQRFLRDEIHRLTLGAAMQVRRGLAVYAVGTEKSRTDFAIALRCALEEMSGNFVANPTADHTQRVVTFADQLSDSQGHLLEAGRFRIGVAQKALHLFLKYEWCLGWIPEPPHCPFDNLIIAKLPKKVRKDWTRIDDIDSYDQLVTAARERAGEVSLACWELALYNTLSAGSMRTRLSELSAGVEGLSATAEPSNDWG